MNHNTKYSAIEEKVYAEQVRLLYRALPASIAANLIASLLIVYIQWNAIAHDSLVIWLCVFVVFILLRSVLCIKYTRTAEIGDYRPWGTAFNIGAGMAGLLWGAAGILMFPAGNELHQMTLIFCLLAMSTGAVSSHSFLKTPPYIFLVFTLTPLFFRIMYEANRFAFFFEAALVLSVVFFLSSAKRNYESTASNIRLRLDAAEKEKEIKKNQKIAEQANHAKDEFLSLMSHELRTPLNAILGFSQLLKADAKDKIIKDNAQEISNAGNHLLELINEILDLSSITIERLSLNMDNFSLNRVISRCLSIIRPLAIENNITITDEITENSDYIVYADQTRIKQIVLNLLSNAIKYNKAKGNILLRCEVINSKRLRIFVIDTGIGMTEEQQANLFIPFERLGAESTTIIAAGIGLNIMRKVLEEMGGDIGVESKIGKGSTIWFDINQSNIKA
ncbi:MAG: ATP-binding protein [Gammaproteobacteria bacterium]|nr:ATP-binding protein [Gammaproteobacteria bacterium]